MASSTGTLRPGTLRARLLVGCCAVLLGGLGASAHPALPHASHDGGTECPVCLHLEGNPPAPAAPPALPAPTATELAAAPAAVVCATLAPAPANSRAPPALPVS